MDTSILHAVDEAVADRFRAIRDRFKEREGDYIYGGYRTMPEQLGWRFRQNLSLKLREPGGLFYVCYPELPAEIAADRHDGMIEHTWHDAASSEFEYTRVKPDEWRREDREPEFLDEDSYDDESEEDCE